MMRSAQDRQTKNVALRYLNQPSGATDTRIRLRDSDRTYERGGRETIHSMADVLRFDYEVDHCKLLSEYLLFAVAGRRLSAIVTPCVIGLDP